MNSDGPEFIPASEPDIRGNELKYLTECIKTGWVSSLGRFVEDFERGFAAYTGRQFGVSVSSGTAALHLVLAALGVGPGDEVIVPDLTFAATVNAVLYCGALPVLADVHPAHWGLDPADVAGKLTSRTKAILAVHLYGHPCDMDPLLELADKHGVPLIEDAAEAHGARYKGRRAGSMGLASCFSFYGNKVITTGEGGMVLTDDHELRERMLVLRDHGMDKSRRYWHNDVGFNYRLTNLQAAVGLAQLERIDELVAAKKDVARRYREGLKRDDLGFPPDRDWAENIYWAFNISLLPGFPLTRDNLLQRLLDERIQARPVFYPVHLMPPYTQYAGPGRDFPVSKRIGLNGVSLPSSAALTGRQIGRVCEVINGL